MLAFSRCKCDQDNLDQLAHGKKVVPTFQNTHHPADCPKGKHDIFMTPSISAAILHWTRNASIMGTRKDTDYVLMCDDDMVPEPDHLERLLAHRVDIVGGICMKRIDPCKPNIRRWVDAVQNYGEILAWDESETLIEVDAIGTAFLLISRKVIEDVGMAYHKFQYEHTGDGWWFEYLRAPGGHEWGEDLSFCWKAQRLGYPIYCDITVNPGHIGDYVFRLADYKEFQAEEIAAAQAAASKDSTRGVLITV
jgi:glycosyltransferase involved in cell wall biosynthesis